MDFIFYGPLAFVLFLIASVVIVATLFTMGIKLIFLLFGVLFWGILILIFPILLSIFIFVMLPLIILLKILF